MRLDNWERCKICHHLIKKGQKEYISEDGKEYHYLCYSAKKEISHRYKGASIAAFISGAIMAIWAGISLASTWDVGYWYAILIGGIVLIVVSAICKITNIISLGKVKRVFGEKHIGKEKETK